jgi:hypothetical protein
MHTALVRWDFIEEFDEQVDPSGATAALGFAGFDVWASVIDHRTIRVESHHSRMADDKSGRDKQARDAERRQRERALDTELERGDETEPPVDTAELADLESELEELDFPVTGAEVVAAVGDREIESVEGSYTIEELIPETDGETFDSPAAIRVQVQRPTIAAAMKRVLEASKTLPDAEFRWTQRKAYERTFQELKAIDADDDDEGIRAISDWIAERIRDKGALPNSRAVRRQAAKFCRANGYQVRNDEWLGV